METRRSGGAVLMAVVGSGARDLDGTFSLSRKPSSGEEGLRGEGAAPGGQAASISFRLRRFPRAMYVCTGSCCQQKSHLL